VSLRQKLLCVLIFVFAALTIAITIAFPIYDEFIWKYFWGPIVADAMGVYSVEHNGIRAFSGYNVVNTATYAILTIAALYAAYRLMEGKADEKTLKKFIFAIFPLIIYGSVARVLEDSGLFQSLYLQALFITPLIYIQILILFLSVIFASVKAGNSRCPPIIIAIIACDISILLLDLAIPMNIFYMIVISSLFLILSFRFRSWEKQGFIFSLFLLSLALYYVAYYSIHNPIRPYVMLFSLSLPAIITALLFFLPLPKYFKSAYSLIAIFSQTLDATATYIGISSFGYYEKHVLPSLLMDVAGPWILIPVKIAVVAIIIYAMRDENETVRNIVMFMVIILGLAPGTRDALRITLGV
jgi:uncharacterized membrane protein